MGKQKEKTLLDKVFDPEDFRKTGHELVDLLARHLSACQAGEGKVLNYISPDQEIAFWSDYKFRSPIEFFNDVRKRSINVHHPGYIGHQVSAPAPLAALAGLISELMNDGMGVYEMGAAATAIERVLIQMFCRTVGFNPENSDGFLTSGGTLANLTALLAARSKYLDESNKEGYILVSDQAHFCIERAAFTMGLGAHQVIKISCKRDFSIDTALLEERISLLISEDKGIIAVVGCACSTSTGSYDNLDRLAQICADRNIWLHIDGAHGGAACFSEKYKHLCKGIEHADSVIIDAHKMMLTPALATAVLFREEEESYKALKIEAAYLFEKQDQEWYNLAKRTYETTKYMMSIKLFVLIKTYGLEVIDQFVTRQYDLTRKFYNLVKEHPNFECGHEPMSNILCFRFLQEKNEENNFYNTAIRKAILENGNYYVVQTTLNSNVYLRITVMSPHTTIEELNSLLTLIIKAADKVSLH